MVNTQRLSIAVAVIVCFVGVQANATLFASENTSSSSETRNATLERVVSADATVLVLSSTERAPLKIDVEALAANLPLTPALHDSALAGQVYRGRRYRPGNNNGSIAAMMIGTAAAITGAALLIYANRPECTANQFAGGCGYGTKVIGGAVLTGGAVGLVVGALTWK